MAGRRLERVAAQLKQALGTIVTQQMSDPRLGFVTITRVEPTADLRSASVYISVLGEDRDERLTLMALRHGRGHIQREVGKQTSLKSIPVLKFELDESVKRSVRMSKIIETMHSDE